MTSGDVSLLLVVVSATTSTATTCLPRLRDETGGG